MEFIKTPHSLREYTNKDGYIVHFYDTGIMSTTLSLKHIDIELTDLEKANEAILSILTNLPKSIRIKINSSSDFHFPLFEKEFNRKDAINRIGYKEHFLTITFERDVPRLKNLFSLFLNNNMKNDSLDETFEEFIKDLDINSLESAGLQPRPIDRNISLERTKIRSIEDGLRIDNAFISIIKLERLGNYENSLEDLTCIRETFNDNYEIALGIEKIDEKEVQFLLNNKAKREESGHDLKSHKRYLEAQKALDEVDNQGKKLFRLEFTVILKFRTHDQLISNSFDIRQRLQRLGDFAIQEKGAILSFIATVPGGRPHINHIELIDRILPFFPLCIRGNETLEIPSKRSFVFHRADDSLDQLDVFDPEYQNFPGIIIGKPGRGKSVFTNVLQQSLLNDPKVKIILVDVRSSHTNMVKNLGGEIYKISSDSQTAMSPFNFLRKDTSRAIVEILSDFIEKLIIEDHESSLLKQEQALVEQSIIDYINLKPTNPSLDDYVKKVKNIPRVDSLKRWVKGGIYDGIFSLYGKDKTDSNIQYFDFQNIVTAQKGGVGPAIMSAVMAHFNFLLLSKKTDERLIFIADETPFFIKNCFSSFNLLMKNVRKLNGSLILIAQNLHDLVVNNDPALIDLSEWKIFFSRDEGNDKFEQRSHLSKRGINILDNLSTVNGQFSLFLLKDPKGERVGKLILSKEEYFRATTHAKDRKAIEKMCDLLETENENVVTEIIANIEEKYRAQL